jgi:hypothetical protein
LEQAHCVAKAKFGPAGGGRVGLWQEYGWLTGEPGTEVVRHSDATRWWTFAGLHANASLAPALAEATGGEATECGKGSGLVFPGNGGGSLPVTARRCSVAPASCLWGGVIDWRRKPGSHGSGSLAGRRHSCHKKQAGRYAVARRQSLKGISILALGSHRRWIPRVPAPTGIQS